MDRTGHEKNLLRALSRVRRAWRANAALQGVLLAVACAALPVAAGVYAGAQGWWRAGLTVLAAVAAAAVLAWRVLWPLLRPLRHGDVSRLVERRTPELDQTLTSALELRDETARARFSHLMLDSLAERAARAAGSVPLSRVIDLRRTARIAVATLIVFAACAAFQAVRPAALSQFAQFVIPPYFPEPEVYAIRSVTGDLIMRRGGAVTIRTELEGDVSGAPTAVLERQGLDPVRRPMKQLRGMKFSVTVDPVDGDTDYHIRYKDKRSRTYHITTVDPPRVQVLRTTLTYPKHTRLPKDQRENAGDISAPYGTRVALDITATSPLKSAHLMLNGKKFPLTLEGKTRATGAFRILGDASYTVHLEDTHGFRNTSPPGYAVHAIPDAPPELEVRRPEGDMTLESAQITPVLGGAGDDYAVTAVNLHYHNETSGRSGSLRVPVEAGPTVSFQYDWDLNRVAEAGDTVSWYLTAADNDALTGPKTVRSAVLRISILSDERRYGETERETDRLIAELSTTVAEARDVAQTLQTTAQEMALQKDTPPEQRAADAAELQRSFERLQSLQQELTDISEEMRENLQEMRENDLFTLDTLEKYRQIQELLDQVLTDEMKELMSKIQRNFEDMDLSNLDPETMDALMDQESLMRNLDRQLERLRRMQAEQKLDALSRELTALAERQEKVLEQSQKLADKQQQGQLGGEDRMALDPLALEEQRLAEELKRAMQRLDDTARELDELDPESGAQLDSLSGQCNSKNPNQSLRRAAGHLQQQQLPQAAEQEESAYKAMLALAKGVDEMNAGMSAHMSQAMKEKLTRILVKTVNLSKNQEQTLDMVDDLDARPKQQMSADEADAVRREARFQRDVTRDLAGNLAELSALSMAVDPNLSGDALRAAAFLDQALEKLKQNPRANVRVEVNNSYILLNRIALALLDAKNSAGQGKGAANSSMQQFMESLQSLADAQENVNSATQRLSSSGMPMPGMKALAAQQRMIRQELEGLGGDMESVGNSGAAKRMQEIQDEMKTIEQELDQGQGGDDVQHIQSNVLKEMRSATLSLKKEDEDERRKAERGREDYETRAPEKLKAQDRPTLPPEILFELNNLKKEPRFPGFEKATDSYYRELLKP